MVTQKTEKCQPWLSSQKERRDYFSQEGRKQMLRTFQWVTASLRVKAHLYNGPERTFVDCLPGSQALSVLISDNHLFLFPFPAVSVQPPEHAPASGHLNSPFPPLQMSASSNHHGLFTLRHSGFLLTFHLIRENSPDHEIEAEFPHPSPTPLTPLLCPALQHLT